MIHILLLVSGLLFPFVAIDGWTLFRRGLRHAGTGRPGLLDILARHRIDLDIVATAHLSRHMIRNLLDAGGSLALDAELRKRYTGGSEWTDWSIDYCYTNFDYSGRRVAGGWSKRATADDREATIYLYKRRTPAPLPAPPSPPDPVRWTAKDEQERIDLFKAGRSAFWLNPDWQGGHNLKDPGTIPFWMFDPAPLLEDGVPDEVTQVARLLADRYSQHRILELDTIGQRESGVVVTAENIYINLSPSQLVAAKRMAAKFMMGKSN